MESADQNPQFDELTAAWNRFWHAQRASKSNKWAAEQLDALIKNDPSAAWQAILRLLQTADTRNALQIAAAGPLQMLLNTHFTQLFDTIKAETIINERLRYALERTCPLNSKNRESLSDFLKTVPLQDVADLPWTEGSEAFREERDVIVTTLIRAWDSSQPREDRTKYLWPIVLLSNFATEEPGELWNIVLAVLESAPDDSYCGFLAPFLGELLGVDFEGWKSTLIEEIKTNERLRLCLQKVYVDDQQHWKILQALANRHEA
jgi:hypothetical protein